jgi:hypothetical protein
MNLAELRSFYGFTDRAVLVTGVVLPIDGGFSAFSGA